MTQNKQNYKHDSSIIVQDLINAATSCGGRVVRNVDMTFGEILQKDPGLHVDIKNAFNRQSGQQHRQGSSASRKKQQIELAHDIDMYGQQDPALVLIQNIDGVGVSKAINGHTRFECFQKGFSGLHLNNLKLKILVVQDIDPAYAQDFDFAVRQATVFSNASERKKSNDLTAKEWIDVIHDNIIKDICPNGVPPGIQRANEMKGDIQRAMVDYKAAFRHHHNAKGKIPKGIMEKLLGTIQAMMEVSATKPRLVSDNGDQSGETSFVPKPAEDPNFIREIKEVRWRQQQRGQGWKSGARGILGEKEWIAMYETIILDRLKNEELHDEDPFMNTHKNRINKLGGLDRLDTESDDVFSADKVITFQSGGDHLTMKSKMIQNWFECHKITTNTKSVSDRHVCVLVLDRLTGGKNSTKHKRLTREQYDLQKKRYIKKHTEEYAHNGNVAAAAMPFFWTIRFPKGDTGIPAEYWSYNFDTQQYEKLV